MKTHLLSLVLAATSALAETQPDWQAHNLAPWTRGGNQCAEARMEGERLRIVAGGGDTHIYSPTFALPSRATHEVVFHAKCDRSGPGELFWMPPNAKPQQKWSTGFHWIGDGKWHEYRVRPFWQGEKTIGRLRIDMPFNAGDGGVFQFDRIAIEDAQDAKPLAIPSEKYDGIVFSMKADTRGNGTVCWANDAESGRHKREFPTIGDGRIHRIYLPLGERRGWRGRIVYLKIEMPDGAPSPDDLQFVEGEIDMPADIVLKSLRSSDGCNRVGYPLSLTLLLENIGTCTANGVTVTAELPEGVSLVNPAACRGLTIAGKDLLSIQPILNVARAGDYKATFTVTASGCAPLKVVVPLTVLPSLNLPKADYVPEPKPVATDYDLAALHFPGWSKPEAWQRVYRRCPERKPILGWYDESNPEVVDWQIKWLVENGIRTLYVDWYWRQGAQHLDHWIKAFDRARYRSLLKWAVMWANHNPPGSHSIEDQKAVTKFWIENYFNTPEYLRINDMPVVWIWSAQNMENDIKDGGCRRLLDVSREMAKSAGFKGIHFIAMKFPETDCSVRLIRKYKDMGFDMTGIYHLMSSLGRVASERRFPYRLVAEASSEHWQKQQDAGILPFLPNLSTGWDDRPWNDHREIYGRNAADFRRICEAAKGFADKYGVKRLCVGPLTEWGEGSYAEPNAEFGFGMYEAVREVFCKRPPAGWPINYGPRDVGLGPYDLPPPEPPKAATAWTFTDGLAHGWKAQMNVGNFTVTPRGLSFATTSDDPAVSCNFAPFAATNFTKVVVRMSVKSSRSTNAQLYWASPGGSVNEGSSFSLPVKNDGEFHDYVFMVSSKRNWRGRVHHFRFDPINLKDANVVISSIICEK